MRGDALFAGDGGSDGARLSGLRISEGSTDSLAIARRDRVAVRGVAGSPAVFRRFCTLEALGAGVNFSSSLPFVTLLASSSSEDSIMTWRRFTALLAGREGDTADILAEFMP